MAVTECGTLLPLSSREFVEAAVGRMGETISHFRAAEPLC
jgi:hypothetical protein